MIYYYTREGVVINTLFNEKECAIVVLLYRIGLITVVLAVELSMAVAILTGVMDVA